MTDITTRLLSMSEAMWMDRDHDELDALLLEAKGEIERFRSDRAYIIGHNDGWEAAIEEAAKLIEDNMLVGAEGEERLIQRSNPGNKLGLAYASAIRALKSDPAPVPAPKPFTFKDPAAQREWERQRKERGE